MKKRDDQEARKAIKKATLYQYESVDEARAHQVEMEKKGWVRMKEEGRDALDYWYVRPVTVPSPRLNMPPKNPNKRPTIINCDRSNAREVAKIRRLIQRIRYEL